VNKRRPFPLLDRVRPDASSVWLAAISVVLATLFWAYTVSELKSVKDVTVPLQFANVPKDLLVVGEDARKTITVEFKGPPDMLKRVREEDVDARIDVSKLVPGPQVVEMGQENVRLPSSVEFVRTLPKLVHFTLDRRLRDSLPLQPNFTGRASSGLQVLSWSIDPPSVQVEGPESVIRKMKRLSTQPVPLDGRTADFDTPVVPTFNDPDITVTNPGPATLHVSLGEKRAQRTLGPVPVRVLHARAPVKVEPESIKVMVEGPESLVRALSAQDVSAEVDAQSLKPADTPYQLRPAVRMSTAGLAGKVAITGWIERFVSVQVGPARGPAADHASGVPGAEGRPLP
jgi:YbbR domain-containing protein